MDNPTVQPLPSNKNVLIVLTVLVLLLLASTGLLAYQNYQLNQKLTAATEKTTTLPTPSQTVAATPDPTANWQTYTNTKYGYTFKYPTGYTVSQNGMDSPTPEISDAVVVNNKNASNFPEEPKLSVVAVVNNYSSFENLVADRYADISTWELDQTNKETAEKNLGFTLEKNRPVKTLQKTTFLGNEAYTYSIYGSFYADEAASGIEPAKERQYMWVNKGGQIFLIRVDKNAQLEQALSTFKFTN